MESGSAAMTETSAGVHRRFRYPPHTTRGRAGASFKPAHLAAILADPSARDCFFEVHAENFMGAGGPPHAMLERLRNDHPVSVHGVCMSIGGPQALDEDHLAGFAALVRRFEPALVSEHLAWSTHDDVFFNDLLPLPYTKVTLDRICEHVDQVQAAIGRQILMENPATYVVFPGSTYAETDFLREIAIRTGCGLLLDVNNVFVSATNHAFSPETYLDAFPLEHVGEIHLAGHDRQQDENGSPLLIDSHDRAVADPVWALYARTIAARGSVPTLVEWDADVPDWPVLRAELRQARAVMQAAPCSAPERISANA
jgi:uncharacterized protein (UPF0276 family)